MYFPVDEFTNGVEDGLVGNEGDDDTSQRLLEPGQYEYLYTYTRGISIENILSYLHFLCEVTMVLEHDLLGAYCSQVC